MSTMSHRRTLAALTAGVALALPAAAFADPPADNLQSTPGRAAQLARSYEMNSVNGEYAPPRTNSLGAGSIHSQIGPAAPSSQVATKGASGFSVGDAATGAGVALLLGGGLVLGARATTRRRQSLSRIGS